MNAEKGSQVVLLRKQGDTFQQIGEKLNMTRQGANAMYNAYSEKPPCKTKKIPEIIPEKDVNFLVRQLDKWMWVDKEYVERKVNILCNSLVNDTSLTLGIFGVEIKKELHQLSSKNKQAFINEYKQLINKYKDLAGSSIRLE